MRNLTKNECGNVTGADAGAGLAVGIFLGVMLDKMWTMNSCADHYVLEQQYEEYSVATAVYNANGIYEGDKIDKYGQYVPVYVPVYG